MAMNQDLSIPCARTTPAAGEAFIQSFTDMTRAMLAQSKALARTVSLAQVLETDSNRDCNTNTGDDHDDDKENIIHAAAASATANNHAGSAYREKVLNDLRSLATIVADLERRAAQVRATVNQERAGIEEMKEMRVAAKQRADDLAAACRHLPQHLPHATPASPFPSPSPSSTIVATTITTTKTATNANDSHASDGRGTARGGHGDEKVISCHLDDNCGGGDGGAYRVAPASSAVVPTVELVTVSELEIVARSTRGRLTIAMVNDAVTEIQKAVEKRHALLTKPRGKLSEKLRRRLDAIHRQEVPEHAGKPFLAASDLRALPAFRKGEVTAKALIATLRSLKRLKEVRAAGVMTYIVEGTSF